MRGDLIALHGGDGTGFFALLAPEEGQVCAIDLEAWLDFCEVPLTLYLTS